MAHSYTSCLFHYTDRSFPITVLKSRLNNAIDPAVDYRPNVPGAGGVSPIAVNASNTSSSKYCRNR